MIAETPSPIPNTSRPTPLALREHWIASRLADPMVRPYDLAQKLGVTELELVAARAGSAEVIRLRHDLDALLPELGALGEVMGLTRNRSAVLEKHGVWSPFSADGGVGLVLDEGLDLRLFLMAWRHSYAVLSETPRGLRRSLQFFDAHGVAVHKLFVRETAERAQQDAFDVLVTRFADPDQTPGAVASPAIKKEDRPDTEVDRAGFQEAWRALKDTHDFFPMLRRFGVGRTQALRLAPEGFATPVPLDAAQRTLEHAAEHELPIMIFVGNRGCIEIHTGPIRKVKVMGPWLNILDPETNLHLRQDHIASAWVVTKPTVDGPVTSLELFDEHGENIALLFGKRKPGLPEDTAWRTFARSLIGSSR
ncbi:MAG TPA: ChuX/HutX family heme-like substrate-binding protein [Myxococcota bacterium]|nr:ChuX/HutX family heme-like substrate-binding protein [Myxococcota bacterium]